jgi:hypothetical protein
MCILPSGVSSFLHNLQELWKAYAVEWLIDRYFDICLTMTAPTRMPTPVSPGIRLKQTPISAGLWDLEHVG